MDKEEVLIHYNCTPTPIVCIQMYKLWTNHRVYVLVVPVARVYASNRVSTIYHGLLIRERRMGGKNWMQ